MDAVAQSPSTRMCAWLPRPPGVRCRMSRHSPTLRRNGRSQGRVGSQNARRSRASRSTQEKVMMGRKTLMLAALAAAAVPGVGRAQAAAKCEIDDRKPKQVPDARDALVTAGIIGKPEEKKKQMA